MKNLYEIFEKFPNGSSLWMDSTFGLKKAHRRLWEMNAKSTHEFYALDLASGKVLRTNGNRVKERALAAYAGGIRNENQSSQVH